VCGPILIIFGRNVAEKVSNETTLYISTSPNYICTTDETGNREIASFA